MLPCEYGDKSLLYSGFLKKALSNEEPTDPIHQDYPFKTAFAIIFSLQLITGI
jgi:hypothetical protein